MNSRVAVTGSTGMLGGCLVAELLRRGYGHIVLPVRSLARLDVLKSTLARLGADPHTGALYPVEANLNDPAALREALAGVDAVFHCAAEVSLRDGDPARLIETNVEITTHVVDAALACGVRRMVHVSSIAALGEARRAGELIDETCGLEEMAGTSPYGISKFLSENRAWRGRTEGLEVVVVNPAVILGEGDWHSGGSTLIIPTAAGGMPFYTSGAVGYVDVRDVARAMVSLCECPAADGERFILCGANLSYREFFTAVAGFAGKRPPRFEAGKFLLGLVWRSERLLSKISGYEPKLSRAAVNSALRTSLYDGGKITRFIKDFSYTPVMETIERVVKAYKDEN